MVFRSALPILVCQVLLAQGAFAMSPEFEKFIDKAPCGKEILQGRYVSQIFTNQRWYPVPVAQPYKPLMMGIAFRNTMTKYGYKLFSDKTSTTLLEANIEGKKESKYVWDKRFSCDVKISGHAWQPKEFKTSSQDFGKKGFTDDDLYKVMKKSEWGVIYVWSPAMPLSVAGIQEMKKAIATVGGNGKLIVLVDGKISFKDVAKVLKLGKVTKAEIKQVASPELYERGVALHYPSVILFKNSFLSNGKYIGYKEAPTYVNWIKKETAVLDASIAQLKLARRSNR